MRPWIACAALAAVQATAQEQLRVQGPTPATVVLGSSARVELVVEGRSAAPREPELPAVPGLLLQLRGPARQVFSSITPSGMTEQVLTQYTLVIQPQREGTFTIPTFRMWTGTREQQVPELRLEVVKELRGAEFGYLDVRVEPGRVYVHEPIRVRVEFGVDRGLRPVLDVHNGTRYVDFEVQAPWLSELEGAEPIAVPEITGDRTPVVLNRTLQMAEYDSDHQRGGRVYHSFVFHKAFLPTRPGQWTLDAPMLRYDVQLREGRRGIFGEPIGGQSQNYYVYGQPLQVEVLPIPEQGRPTPYYGAVGRFTVDAALDRDTVKVGSSVKLTFTIRGRGNLEFLRAPELQGFEVRGLHLLGQTEVRKEDEVAVTYDLTPLHADVQEVPAVAWNFFDTTPGVERFETVSSRALPIHVQPLAEGERLRPLPDADKGPVRPGVDDIFDLPDLSGPPMPLPRLAPAVPWLVAFGPWAVLVLLRLQLAFLRRRAADPLAVRARAALRNCERALAAGAEPVAALVGYLGDRLGVPPAAVIGADLPDRLHAAGLDGTLVDEATSAVEQGVAARYGGGHGLDAETVRSLVVRLEQARPRRLPPVSAALWLGALLIAGTAAAQGEAGLQAYRQGDYAAAEAAFAKALERGDDRRLWFARGNCFYRLGDLPRALWAYECARLGLPREAELRANVALVEQKLELGGQGGEPFAAAVAALRQGFTATELAGLCAFSMTLAGAGLLFGWRRPLVRWLAIVVLAHGVLIAVELLWLRPQRAPTAIALQKLEIAAEPRAGMAAVATVQPGARLDVLSGASGEWVRVEAGERKGYARRELLAVVE